MVITWSCMHSRAYFRRAMVESTTCSQVLMVRAYPAASIHTIPRQLSKPSITSRGKFAHVTLYTNWVTGQLGHWVGYRRTAGALSPARQALQTSGPPVHDPARHGIPAAARMLRCVMCPSTHMAPLHGTLSSLQSQRTAS